MKKLINYLTKQNPDYLLHFGVGAIVFEFLNLFFDAYGSVAFLLVGCWLWEIGQKMRGGNNSKQEMFFDILFGIGFGLISIILNLIF